MIRIVKGFFHFPGSSLNLLTKCISSAAVDDYLCISVLLDSNQQLNEENASLRSYHLLSCHGILRIPCKIDSIYNYSVLHVECAFKGMVPLHKYFLRKTVSFFS